MGFNLNDSLKQQVPSFKGQVNDLQKKANGIQKDVEKQINNLRSNVEGVLNSTLEGLAGGLPKIDNVFNDIFGADGDLHSTINKGILETKDKLESLASNSASALAKPVSFVTKAVEDTVSGIDSSKLAGQLGSVVDKIDDDLKATISKATGKVVENATDLSSAISAVSKDVVKGISNVKEGLGETIHGVTSGISSTVNDFSSSIKNGLNSVIDESAYKELKNTVSGAFDASKGAINDVLSFLPVELQDYVSGKSKEYISGVVDNILGDRAKSLSKILGQLSTLGDQDAITSIFSDLGGAYCAIVTTEGACQGGKYGDNSMDTIDKIYAVANLICNNINYEGGIDFKHNKDLYDVLLGLAARYGIPDLIDQLKKCKKGENAYFDKRSAELLRKMSDKVALSGDTSTYASIQSAVGPGNMQNAEEQTVKLIANTKYEQPMNRIAIQKNETRKANIDKIMENYNLTPDDLYRADDLGLEVIDANKVLLMTSTDTTFVDTNIGRDTRTLIQSLVVLSN